MSKKARRTRPEVRGEAPGLMDAYQTGATRSSAEARPDYRGFISPIAIRLFGEYMLKNQTQADGSIRTSDNWKKGMPIQRYIESLLRHTNAFHEATDELKHGWNDDPAAAFADAMEHACAILFNIQGWLHENGKLILDGQEPPAV